MSQAEIIDSYENILRVTGEMLAAARGADWERLVALEVDCRAMVAELKPRDAAVPLAGKQLQRKVEIIQGILANDAEIRDQVQPWMAHMQQYLGNAGRARQLRAAYDSDK